MSSSNNNLLPSGFYDLIYPKSQLHFNIIDDISKHFERFSYQRVTPPVAEFEETIFTDSGKSLENNTFRVMDPISHKMMGIRADMTVQVARIARTRLKETPRPLRLFYSGNVFRVKGKGLDSERQLTQIGLELIGKNNAIADSEVISVTIEALEKIGIKDICLDLNLPILTSILLTDIKNTEQKNQITSFVSRKDISSIEKYDFANKDIILDIISNNFNIDLFENNDLPENAKKLFQRIIDIKKLLLSKHENLSITVDPLINDKFNYHNGIGFSIFTKSAPFEIGRGGRYLIDDNETAIGSTIYINELIKILPSNKDKKTILVEFNEKKQVISDLQDKGYLVAYSLDTVS